MNEQKRFQKNLELWAQYHPKVAIMLPYYEAENLAGCQTMDGQNNLILKEGGYFHSQQDPLQEAHDWFAGLPLENINVLYVYGIGLGYAYEAAKAWLHEKDDRHLAFLEDDLGVIRAFFYTERATKMLSDAQVHLAFFTNLKEEVFEELFWNKTMTRITVSALPFYQKIKPEIFEELQHKLVYDASVKNALLEEYLKFGVGFYKNFYHNALEMDQSYLGDKLFGQFKAIPAIICGAGPSLEKQLPLLRASMDRALIFAGGSALNALCAAGMLAHFGAGIDPNATQAERLSKNSAFEVPFFYRNRLFHPAFTHIHGPRLYITGAGGYDVAEWLEERLGIKGDYLDEGHNVVNFCVEVAHALGCNPIIFVGMDLAYTGKQAYAAGVDNDAKMSPAEELLLRKDIYGEPIHTLWKWISEANWISDFGKSHPQIELINATEGGIGFPDVPNKTFQEVVAGLSETYDLHGRVHGEIQNSVMGISKKQIREVLEELHTSLQSCLGHLEIMIEETQNLRKKIKASKTIPPMLQSGRAALSEHEISEEPAYAAVLDIFNAVYAKVLNRALQQLKKSRSKVVQTTKKLELQEKKLGFLRDAARMNVYLLETALKGAEHGS